MKKEIELKDDDKIAIIVPYKGEEYLGTASLLLKVPGITDVFALCDKENKDDRFFRNPDIVKGIDFGLYTKVFFPWIRSLDKDCQFVSAFCIYEIRRQKASAKCYYYETDTAFHEPTHYIDITSLEDKKRELINTHEENNKKAEAMLSLNSYRGAQNMDSQNIAFEEDYIEVDVNNYDDSPDLLLKLYTIRDNLDLSESFKKKGIEIKNVMPMNISLVYGFISDNFGKTTADETMPALINGDCFVAVRDKELLGFAAVEATAKGYVGPCGVISKERKKGIATALMIRSLHRIREKGYTYAIAGMVSISMRVIIEKVVDCIPIPNSIGSYNDMILP